MSGPATAAFSFTPLGAMALAAMALREAREMFERDYLNAQIMRFGGNILRTASFIGTIIAMLVAIPLGLMLGIELAPDFAARANAVNPAISRNSGRNSSR